MDDHIRFRDEDLVLDLLDQRRLPAFEERFLCRKTSDIVHALKAMVVRGAPAIGVTAAFGCAIAAAEVAGRADWKEALAARFAQIAGARPTAVNLARAVADMAAVARRSQAASPQALLPLLVARAKAIREADLASCHAQGRFGAPCIPQGATVMTHCNAGALATAGYGTALGVIRAAHAAGRLRGVIANETRPFLQGARLTAWELARDGIPVTVACDNACAHLMAHGFVQCVVVGADRVAANGDTANKIGTCGVALLARHYGIPFYVACPVTTIDPATPDGAAIPIEERPSEEVAFLAGTRITPEGVPVFNFAFDVTPAGCITGIITDRGVLRPPYGPAIAALFAAGESR